MGTFEDIEESKYNQQVEETVRGFNQMKPEADQYGIEISGDTAYTTNITDSSVYHAAYRDNDFVGSLEECRRYLNNKKIVKIIGPLAE
jgi:hypothetical protein